MRCRRPDCMESPMEHMAFCNPANVECGPFGNEDTEGTLTLGL